MKVTRIAETVIDGLAIAEATEGYDPWCIDGEEQSVSHIDALAEVAGRACYQSWSRPNEATRKNADYIRSAVHEKGHESIMAHASVTYYITGVSRALTHELIRHRFLAFSELSQRYVDMGEALYVEPPALTNEYDRADLAGLVGLARERYDLIVESLKEGGLSNKAAREAARAVLPSAMETKIVVTGNIRAFRDFLNQRWSVHADAEIRQLAGEILKDLRLVAPNSVADIPEEPYQ